MSKSTSPESSAALKSRLKALCKRRAEVETLIRFLENVRLPARPASLPLAAAPPPGSEPKSREHARPA